MSGVAVAITSGVRPWGLTVAHRVLRGNANTCSPSAGEVAAISPVDDVCQSEAASGCGTLPVPLGLPPRAP